MKNLFIALTVFVFGQALAQQKETVYSIAKEVREISWYEKQQELWKAETEKNKNNGEAWYNYFAATRALKNLSNSFYMTQAEATKKREQYEKQCEQIADAALKAIPNSFEANHIKFWNGDLIKDNSYLLKAHQISPNDARAFHNLMIHYELQGNQKEHERFAQKCFESGELPAGILNWGYNLLSELEPNAILFTVGDNDTYAVWIVQSAKNFRKDVKVVNTSLLNYDDYRNRIFKDLGYSDLVINKLLEDYDNFENNQLKIFNHLFTGKRPAYVAATGIEAFKEKYGDKLYLTGLAYKYGSEPIDNISIIKRNFEKRYLLDHLTEVFSFNVYDKVVGGFNETYLPSLMKLHKHYQDSEEFAKAKNLEKYIVSISEESGKQGEVLDLLEKDESSNSIIINTLLDVKTIEKNMLPFKEHLYMSRYETSNEEYKKFLENLKRSKKFELYKAAVYDTNGWLRPNKALKTKKEGELWIKSYYSHVAFNKFPVVSVPHEGAIAYCEWLTQQYNSQRKRKYTQVVFRLPTEQEWKLAAGSGNENAKTPFPNDNIQNADKCYLANIRPEEFAPSADGLDFMGKIDNYLPNKIGLYNMFGNVAEMIDKKGIAKGGSWYNTFDESTFDKQQIYTLPEPGIGFRIVMEVIVK